MKMNIENAPDDSLICSAQVKALVGISHSGLWKLLQENQFPKPVMKIGNRRRWHLGTVRKFIRGQV